MFLDEISAARDLNMDNSTDLATLLSSKLPPTTSTTTTTTTSSSANGGECESNNITTSTPSSGNGTSSCTTTIVSTSSTNCASTNSNSTSTNNITIARPILNNNGNQSKIPSTGNSSIASSLPDHFGTSFDSNHFGNLQSQLFNRETTPPMSNLGTAPTTGSQVNLGQGNNFLVNSGSSTNNQTSGPGPIARPRSYSSSNAHTSSMTAAANNNIGETLLSSYFKNVEEKNNLLLNGPHANRKLSTPSSSLFASGGNHSSLFSSLSNRDSGSLFGAPVYSSTADTVESCLGLAVEDLSLEDIHLEAALEKELGPSSQSRGNNNNLVDTVDPVSNTNSVLGRSPGQSALLGSTAPVNIPG